MIAIIYIKADNKIIGFIRNVVSHTDTDITGQDESVRGIDLTVAGFAMVEPVAVNVTFEDITREFTDTEFVDNLPVPVTKTEILGRREIIKVVLAEGGPELGLGDILDLTGLVDVRGQLPLSPEQEKERRIADLELALADMIASQLV